MTDEAIAIALTALALTALFGLFWLLSFRLILDAIKKSFAHGEASAYRQQNDLPPVYADGPETEIDLSNLLGNYEGGDEYQSDGDPEPEPARVRVNMSGPTHKTAE